jgi:hypothetical protein
MKLDSNTSYISSRRASTPACLEGETSSLLREIGVLGASWRIKEMTAKKVNPLEAKTSPKLI